MITKIQLRSDHEHFREYFQTLMWLTTKAIVHTKLSLITIYVYDFELDHSMFQSLRKWEENHNYTSSLSSNGE